MFPDLRQIHRRSFIGNTSRGLGAVALASLLGRTGLEAAPGVLSKLPLPQKAKRVIWLTMAGGPSQLELFDHKPKLAEMDGKGMPETHYGPLSSAIRACGPDGKGRTDYFAFRCFKNQNLHLEFLRPELLERFNLLAGRNRLPSPDE